MSCWSSRSYPSATAASHAAGAATSQSPALMIIVVTSAVLALVDRCATIRLSWVPSPKSMTIERKAAYVRARESSPKRAGPR